MTDSRLDRLHALAAAAARLENPADPLGQKARELLLETTGLSREGIELGLRRHLEHRVGRAALSQLVRRAPVAPAAHVLLSANVFVAAFRAIALGLAQSERVFVRASRRAPTLAELLHEASGSAFELVDQLTPAPGEHLWAYGSAETLQALRSNLPAGVELHAHGPGMGVVVIQEKGLGRALSLSEAASAIAEDTIAFDQRGCLSPRLLLLEGEASFLDQFAEALALALEHGEELVPRGTLNDAEQADALRFERTMIHLGAARRAGLGMVALDPVSERLFIPPVGRYLGLVHTRDPLARLRELGARLSCVAVLGDEALAGRVQACVPGCRVVLPGKMQLPPFDGPVDLRSGWTTERI